LTLLPPSPSTLFPYTTLFRSLRLGPLRCESHSGMSDLRRESVPRNRRSRAMQQASAHRSPDRLIWSPSESYHIPHRTLLRAASEDRKSTRLNSSHEWISYAVF